MYDRSLCAGPRLFDPTVGSSSTEIRTRPRALDASEGAGRKPDTPVAYRTKLGAMYQCTVEDFLRSETASTIHGRTHLLFTSPPFPLIRTKSYGNRLGDDYLSWLEELAKPLGELLAPDGSLVIEVGNAWEPGEPVMSTLPIRTMLKMLEAGGFHLCQQFVVHNPARLPSPAQWVTVERVRVKDAYTNVWWMSRSPRPKANNRHVLTPYSTAMQALLKRQGHRSGIRPSGHRVGGSSFRRDNGGAISSNVLTIANTTSTDAYTRYCRERGLDLHPARMPSALAEFFIRFLTAEGDLVVDPFAGSNTTGAAAERLNRQWLALEPQEQYVAGSRGRFIGEAR